MALKVSAKAQEDIRIADAWWRANRPAAPHLLREELRQAALKRRDRIETRASALTEVERVLLRALAITDPEHEPSRRLAVDAVGK